MKIYNDYEIHDYLESEIEDGYDATIKKWVALDDLIKCIDDTYKNLDMGKTIPIFIQRLKENLQESHKKDKNGNQM